MGANTNRCSVLVAVFALELFAIVVYAQQYVSFAMLEYAIVVLTVLLFVLAKGVQWNTVFSSITS